MTKATKNKITKIEPINDDLILSKNTSFAHLWNYLSKRPLKNTWKIYTMIISIMMCIFYIGYYSNDIKSKNEAYDIKISNTEMKNQNIILKKDNDSLQKKISEIYSVNKPSEVSLFTFNTDPLDLPTILVANRSKDLFDEPPHWKNKIAVDIGDTILVQIYFHNSTRFLAEEVKVGMSPIVSKISREHTFTGGVASTTLYGAQGSAIVNTNSASTIAFIPGLAKLYKHGSNMAWEVENENLLFKDGISIGAVSPGWDNQGAVVAWFRVY